MSETAHPIDRHEGRQLFGTNPSLYDSARPDYPRQIYEILHDRCQLAAGSRVLEVGPGTGQVTIRIGRLGAAVTAVEPDRALAACLARKTANTGLAVDIRISSFEDAVLPSDTFDIAVAATSFHWIDQAAGLRKVRRLLVPRGWWAMWWNVFADTSREDPFYDAATPVMRRLRPSPSAGDPGKPSFALDSDSRRRELIAAGFDNVEMDVVRWTMRLNAQHVRALYATFSPIACLPARQRVTTLDRLAAIVDDEFDGCVERAFQTALYTSQRR